MPSHDPDRSLLYLRLESFVSARWGLGGLLRPRAASLERPTHISPAQCALADFLWIAFADERSPHAVGIRLHTTDPGAPRYEIAEWTHCGEVNRSLWRFQRFGGWQQLNTAAFPIRPGAHAR